MHAKGFVFDLDGVITQTAKLHFQAWKKVFDSYLEERHSGSQGEFVSFEYDKDYIPYVDGRSRYEGVKVFLDSRGITVPYGDPQDDPEKNTVCGVGNRKNRLFRELIGEQGVEVYPHAVEFIEGLAAQGIKIGVATSSKNGSYIIEHMKLDRMFQTVVDGNVAAELGLRSKPRGDLFVTAAKRMGLTPAECAMAEDALSGVAAGKNGNFSLVVGIARHNNEKQLYAHGADMVVSDLRQLNLQRISNWFEKGLPRENWILRFRDFDPEEEKLRETLTTVGNGYLGTRGCCLNERGSETHYPGTYIAGVYNRLPTRIHGKNIENNDLVNCPNWLLLELNIGSSHNIYPFEAEILDYEHSLDMYNAELKRVITYRDKAGRITTVESYRIASMDNPHCVALKYIIIPHNYSAEMAVKSALDGTVYNNGVQRYRNLNSNHLSPVDAGKTSPGIYLTTETVTSRVFIYMNAATRIYQGGKIIEEPVHVHKRSGFISEIFEVRVIQGQPVVIEKMVSIYTSLDNDVPDPREAALETLKQMENYSRLFSHHKKRWHELWENMDFRIEGDRFTQNSIRLHCYHLLCTASPHICGKDPGIPARGLHGEAYRGHIFWDTLFILPFFILHFPDIARSQLLYRYKRLDQARQYASEHGYKGAMYPWQSADSGVEESQTLHYNPVSGEWDPDLSSRQRHISLAVCYNVITYYEYTADDEFLYDYGLEMLVEIARFWAGIATFEEEDGRYHINGVMGPDEFHEKYPDTKQGGLNDNAYTNILVAWVLRKTVQILTGVPGKVRDNLEKKLAFSAEETGLWEKISSGLYLEIDSHGLLSQYAGYMKLEEIDWERYRRKYKNIQRLDRILKSEDDTPDRYKINKQADVLMLFYLLSPEAVCAVIERLGYKPGDAVQFLATNYDYYVSRSSNGSTLSYVVHSFILQYLHRTDEMWQRFLIALGSDIRDIQGGTTAEGIHCGVMGGTIDILVRALAGLDLNNEPSAAHPHIPPHWKSLEFNFIYRKRRYVYRYDENGVSITPL